MKMLKVIFCLLLFPVVMAAQNPMPTDWAKVYGDSLNQRPQRIKAYGDGIYVAGETEVAGKVYGTFTKFDPGTGTIVWQKRVKTESSFSDFAYDPQTDEFIVVGGSQPFSSTFDNNSLIYKFDDNGNILRARVYDFRGREGFTRIVRHPNPADINFPYYLLGGKNPDANFPSSFDEAVLLNLDHNLNDNWEREYKEVSGVEIEAVRGLVPLANGDLLILGNGSVANEGVVLEIRGSDGANLQSLYYPDFIDFYDAVELPNGEIALAGQRFQSRQAILLIVDPVSFRTNVGMIFQDIDVFKEIGFANPATNNGAYPIYLVGQKKSGTTMHHVMSEINYVPGSSLGINYNRFLDPTIGNNFADPHFFVTPASNRIFYAESREYAPAIFGQREILVGNFTLDFDPFCSDTEPEQILGYNVNPVPFQMFLRTKINGTNFFPVDGSEDIALLCQYTCQPPVPCTADFSFETECCEGFFTSNVTGTAPFIYQWDLNCDGVADGLGNVPSTGISFPGPGTYQVCLTVTDAAGCTQTVQKAVTVVDDPPVFNCTNVLIPTDPGECFATYTPIIDVTDDCTAMLRPSCTYSGAINGQGVIDSFPKGITTVNCAVEDNKGQLARCQFTITVEDRERPTISCQAPAPVTVPACAGGANVSWLAATFSDNCPMARIDSTHASGDFFSCGRTTVTYTATDMAGNTETCSFQVVVNCACGEAGNGEIECTEVDNQYAFSLSVVDLTGSAPGNCQITVSGPGGVTVSNVTVSGTGPNYTVTGLVDLATPPIPTSFQLMVNLNCVCPDGTAHQCSLPVNFTTPCCKEIAIDDQEQCRSNGNVIINLLGCSNLFDVRQVRYYVSDAPCLPGSPMTLIQVTQDCQPLSLAPQYHNADVCVYAEVDMGPAAGPCRQLRTDTALVKLCSPVQGSVPDQQLCYTGTPVVPAPFSLSIANPDTCSYSVQWFDASGPIAGATGLTYQPPALSMTAGSNQCNESVTYRAEITSICGTYTATATVRLDNNDAPTGVIKLLAPDTNPICYGEDAALEYFRSCQQPGDCWTWQQSLDGIAYNDITTNGDQNPIFWTNRLYQDHWYRITEQNGVCSVDTVGYFLDVIDPLTITSFTAAHSPVCDPTQVDMTVDWTPAYGPGDPCFYKLVWYHNGNVVHTENAQAGPRTFSYVPPPGEILAGNFYVEIGASCCNQQVKSAVVTLDPPMEVLLAGPCFRCKKDTIVLEGIVLNPPAGHTCTYRWYDNGGLLTGPTGTTLNVEPWRDGPFTFEVTCSNGCTKSATYNLKQCGPGVPVGTTELSLLASNVFPNPTNGPVRIELETAAAFQSLQVFTLAGQFVREFGNQPMRLVHDLDLGDLPAGGYILRGISPQGTLLVVKLIKE